MGQIQLANFKGHEVQHLFNNNLECLFNHLMFDNKLFFFQVQGTKQS